jgi:hypothetical protein
MNLIHDSNHDLPCDSNQIGSGILTTLARSTFDVEFFRLIELSDYQAGLPEQVAGNLGRLLPRIRDTQRLEHESETQRREQIIQRVSALFLALLYIQSHRLSSQCICLDVLVECISFALDFVPVHFHVLTYDVCPHRTYPVPTSLNNIPDVDRIQHCRPQPQFTAARSVVAQTKWLHRKWPQEHYGADQCLDTRQTRGQAN